MSRHWNRLRSAIGRWVRVWRRDDGRRAEFDSFLQHDIDARIEAGMSPAEARRTALAAFGGVTQVTEQVDAARAGAWVDEIVRDLRYSARAAWRSLGLSTAIVGSLALGIAAMVAAVAFINAIAFRPFPGVRAQDELVEVELRRLPGGQPPGNLLWSGDDYEALRAGLTGSADLTAASFVIVTVTLPEARHLPALLVSANYFDVLGAHLSIGRGFHPDEDRPASAAVAVISHRVWSRDFAADPGVVGRVIRVGGTPVQIVGVAAPHFGGTHVRLGAESPEIWLPLVHGDRVVPESSSMPGRERGLRFVGRLRPGVAREQVEGLVTAVGIDRIASTGFASTHTPGVAVEPVSMLAPSFRAQAVGLTLTIPVIVLIIACVNAANLMLARGSRQRREVAIRLAIGAGRARVVRQLLFESLVLAVAATAIAVPIAWWLLEVASARLVVPMPIDGIVLAWTAAVTIVSTALFGLAPALRVTARAPLQALSITRAVTSHTPAQSRGMRALVVAQVALSIGLLATSTQLVSMVEANGGAAGTPPDRLLMASFDLDQLKFAPEDASSFYTRLLEAARTLPGVESAGIARRTAVWTFGRGKGPGSVVVWKAGEGPGEGEVVIGGFAGGELFQTLGLDLIEGRAFASADRGDTPRVAIVNEVYARQFPGGRAIGQTVRVIGHNQSARRTSAEAFAAGREVQIVGVIESADEPRYSRDGEPVAKIYLPSTLQPEPALTLYARTQGDANASVPALRALVSTVDPRVPVAEAGSLALFNERSMGPVVWLTRSASVMGFVALLLAAAGLLAVASYVVAQRSREFAIRIALGAAPNGVLLLVVRQYMRIVAVGFAVGGTIAVGITQVLRSEFRGAGVLDFTAFLASTAALAAVMLVASLIPAGRAARMDPVENLKEG